MLELAQKESEEDFNLVYFFGENNKDLKKMVERKIFLNIFSKSAPCSITQSLLKLWGVF
ncbi:MAG: hypothetical protein MRERC_1c204 [Mycoplasmataceae bacterium RC_NB112A]|nr:MAG: hypothetical protein MRERC_1c204 [Mycoplasmataceae bacterium RC_NB112A]